MTASLRLVNISNFRLLYAFVSLFVDETSRKCAETGMRTDLKYPNQASLVGYTQWANYDHNDINIRSEYT